MALHRNIQDNPKLSQFTSRLATNNLSPLHLLAQSCSRHHLLLSCGSVDRQIDQISAKTPASIYQQHTSTLPPSILPDISCNGTLVDPLHPLLHGQRRSMVLVPILSRHHTNRQITISNTYLTGSHNKRQCTSRLFLGFATVRLGGLPQAI